MRDRGGGDPHSAALGLLRLRPVLPPLLRPVLPPLLRVAAGGGLGGGLDAAVGALVRVGFRVRARVRVRVRVRVSSSAAPWLSMCLAKQTAASTADAKPPRNMRLLLPSPLPSSGGGARHSYCSSA